MRLNTRRVDEIVSMMTNSSMSRRNVLPVASLMPEASGGPCDVAVGAHVVSMPSHVTLATDEMPAHQTVF
ncbi:MAG: hypothetical protein ACOYXT_08485 [Bacteroidota bacterium]